MTNLAKAFALLTEPVVGPTGDKDFINGLMRYRMLEAARCLRAASREIAGLLGGMSPRVDEALQLLELPHVEDL